MENLESATRSASLKIGANVGAHARCARMETRRTAIRASAAAATEASCPHMDVWRRGFDLIDLSMARIPARNPRSCPHRSKRADRPEKCLELSIFMNGLENL
ncbi:hypothetical protein RDV84_06950 [Lysobacter yananisis]|nr:MULTISPECIES: hypothetical protein [Lysobacter]QCW28542.1 hypothetical protein FE772_25735 [Lysobacter enzymogenes]WMT04563.1 hypothetical protein RDV84_06950 [Lysobacter yananisis]